MPSLKDTKRRIGTVKNTQKITRAMKLVSAAKFARANNAVVCSRPYREQMLNLVERFIEADGEKTSEFTHNGKDDASKKVLVIVVASDRGLCGGLNTNILRKVESLSLDPSSTELMLWGKRAHFVEKKLGIKANEKRERVTDSVTPGFCRNLGKSLMERYKSGELSKVLVVYSKFVNAMSQVTESMQLLPLDATSQTEKQEIQCLTEPGSKELSEEVAQAYLANQIYGCVLESSASEHAARMTAMDNATTNAEEVIRKLTLQYNRARQAAITKELIEITAGAEAL